MDRDTDSTTDSIKDIIFEFRPILQSNITRKSKGKFTHVVNDWLPFLTKTVERNERDDTSAIADQTTPTNSRCAGYSRGNSGSSLQNF
jgi:hypothetical protein